MALQQKDYCSMWSFVFPDNSFTAQASQTSILGLFLALIVYCNPIQNRPTDHLLMLKCYSVEMTQPLAVAQYCTLSS